MDTFQTNKNSNAAILFDAEQQLRNGANWFYWIAGLSVINTVLMVTGANIVFVVGLGITQFFDALAVTAAAEGGQESAVVLQIVGFIINTIIAGFFIFFGVLSNKKIKWAYIAGMILYTFDTLLFIIFFDMLSLGFHIFALFMLFKGFKALQNIVRLENEARMQQMMHPSQKPIV